MTQIETSASHRVLLVDDDEAIRAVMTLRLEHKGFASLLPPM
jgi:DNA-binding response OmpR family regulator